MRLTELNPRWTGSGEIGKSELIVGVTFDCPHCRTQRLGVVFKNAIDPHGWIAKGVTRHRDKNEWDRKGDTFDTLTLTPSIDTSQCDFQGHWHGYIENGEVK
jgi:hypothetical protein